MFFVITSSCFSLKVLMDHVWECRVLGSRNTLWKATFVGHKSETKQNLNSWQEIEELRKGPKGPQCNYDFMNKIEVRSKIG